MASREQNKHQRRQDILNAARSLLRDAGDEGFSMRALAEVAGVSIATPYNLFGSKQAILVSLLDADLAAYETALADLRVTGVEVLFEAVGLMARFLEEEPDFYRNVLATTVHNGGPELRHMINGPRYVLWKKLLREAAATGALRDDLDPDAFAIAWSQILGSNVLEWALGMLTLAEMKARCRYGLALVLAAIATPPSRDALERHLREAEAALQTLWRGALEDRLRDGPIDPESEAVLADQLKHVEAPATTRPRGKEKVA